MPISISVSLQATAEPVPVRQAAQPAGGRQATTQAAKASEQATQNAEQAAVNAEQMVRDAVQAADNAVNAPAAIQSTEPVMRDGQGIFTVQDGSGGTTRISIGTEGIRIGSESGAMTTVPINKVVPEGVVQITTGFFAMIVLVVIGGPIARAFARRMNRRTDTMQLSSAVQARLDAMERNIDTVAVELEKVSEGQRFTTKLLADRQPDYAQRSDR